MKSKNLRPHDSSKTRVFPAFSSICDVGRLRDFFEFINEGQGQHAIALDGVQWSEACVRFADGKGKGEKSLRPSRDLLYWMVLNAGIDKRVRFKWNSDLSEETNRKRELLFGGDLVIRNLALEKLSQGCVSGNGGWPVLEGDSKPDVFISTNNFICVVEGKRTESQATHHTSYFGERDQLLRHMDAALEISDGRPVYGVTLYEGGLGFEPGRFTTRSLPHRSKTIQEKLRRGYMKAKTWQQLQRYFYKRFQLDLGYIKEIKDEENILEDYPPL